MSVHHQQKGFALITVMLIVALIAMITGSLVYQQGVQVQRSSYLLHQSQAWAVALGLERWVKKGLQLDLQNNQTDNLNEQWAQPLPPMPFAGGEVSGQLRDMNGRLNVNNLLATNSSERKAWRAVFRRFFRQQWQQPNQVLVLEDWLDADNDPMRTDAGLGVESDTYLLKQPPYRAANRKMVMLSEMGLLEGITPAMLQKVSPFLTALPTTTKVNVNTAPKAVLLAFADWLQPQWMEAWIQQRKQSPAKQTADFRAFIVKQSGLKAETVNQTFSEAMITVQSRYFRLDGTISFGEVEQHLSGLFDRMDKQHIYLIQRWLRP